MCPLASVLAKICLIIQYLMRLFYVHNICLILSVNSLFASVFSVQPRECKYLHADFYLIYYLALPLAGLHTLLFCFACFLSFKIR